MDYIVVFVLGMIAAGLILKLVIRRAIDRALDRMAQEDQESPVTKDVANMELRVEFDRNIYFCYNVTDGAFVCQGSNLSEIQSNFRSRFPSVNAVIVDGDDSSVGWLKAEMSKSNDSDARTTS